LKKLTKKSLLTLATATLKASAMTN